MNCNVRCIFSYPGETFFNKKNVIFSLQISSRKKNISCQTDQKKKEKEKKKEKKDLFCESRKDQKTKFRKDRQETRKKQYRLKRCVFLQA